MLQGIAVTVFIFALMIYSGWWAFFTDHALKTQKRLPIGLRRAPVLPWLTRPIAIAAFVFFAIGFVLAIALMLFGTAGG